MIKYSMTARIISALMLIVLLSALFGQGCGGLRADDSIWGQVTDAGTGAPFDSA